MQGLLLGGLAMNKYQRLLNRTSKQAEANHRMSTKLKYKDKWLENGTSMNHPIYIAYEAEFIKPSYRQIRKTIKHVCKDIDDLKSYLGRTIKDNEDKYYMLFNEDIKYNSR